MSAYSVDGPKSASAESADILHAIQQRHLEPSAAHEHLRIAHSRKIMNWETNRHAKWACRWSKATGIGVKVWHHDSSHNTTRIIDEGNQPLDSIGPSKAVRTESCNRFVFGAWNAYRRCVGLEEFWLARYYRSMEYLGVRALEWRSLVTTVCGTLPFESTVSQRMLQFDRSVRSQSTLGFECLDVSSCEISRF